MRPDTYGRFINYASRPGTGMHSCRNNTCSVNGWANLGDPLTDFCYYEGQTLEGNIHWDFVTNRRTGLAGWTNENWLQDKSQMTHCWSLLERQQLDPERSAVIAAMEADTDIFPLITGIAYEERFGFSVQSQRHTASVIKEWCVLNRHDYLYEWPRPIASMTDDEVIAAILADRDTWLIPAPVADTAG